MGWAPFWTALSRGMVLVEGESIEKSRTAKACGKSILTGPLSVVFYQQAPLVSGLDLADESIR